MADGDISEEVKRFLLEKIDLIAQWEGLLTLQAKPEKAWAVEEVAQNLYISVPETARLLADLEARAMITSVRTPSQLAYRYQPCTAELDMVIKRAAELYRRSLIPITDIIHSKSRSRAQEFANAFKIRKD